MRTPTPSFLGLLLASCVIAAPAIQSSPASQQPAVAYPIGQNGSNAKVAGRLFNIDGKVEYFAGKFVPILDSRADI